ncbi:hypothetical protein LTR48_000358 [Friedmanniomyces endolithicus]|uniref:Uncharacterized protein n=1 Tax=Rachicladosporium monterosium TaxID=1507873 RepID=A0ABR0LI76_9PEZI|nr:hypothetical protein LTR48_000358 [Friedmanniomyces endolithicus]KAK5148555.1 hypothetical protein LTR32_000152 [Rachicladosporium monterosium]
MQLQRSLWLLASLTAYAAAQTTTRASSAEAASTASSGGSGSSIALVSVLTPSPLASDVVYTTTYTEPVYMTTNTLRQGWVTYSTSTTTGVYTGTSTAGSIPGTASPPDYVASATAEAGSLPTAVRNYALGGVAGAALGLAALL